MYTSLRITSPSATPVVDLHTLKQHCRVYFQDDDGLLDNFYLPAATQWAEQILGRCLITTSLKWTVSYAQRHSGTVADSWSMYGSVWPYNNHRHRQHVLDLTRSPVQSVTSVTLGRPDGTTMVLDPSQYSLEIATDPARIRIHHHEHTRDLHWIEIDYIAGYGDTAETVPMPIRNAVMLYTSFLYENKGAQGGALPIAAECLLAPYRVHYQG